MVIFLDTLVTICDCSVRDAIDVVGICESIVPEVVAHCCSDNTYQIKISQLSYFVELSLFHEEKCHL